MVTVYACVPVVAVSPSTCTAVPATVVVAVPAAWVVLVSVYAKGPPTAPVVVLVRTTWGRAKNEIG